MINKGDIVTIIEKVYIDYPGGSYGEHFVERKTHLRVKTQPTNSGKFNAVNCRGKVYHNIYESDVIAINGLPVKRSEPIIRKFARIAPATNWHNIGEAADYYEEKILARQGC